MNSLLEGLKAGKEKICVCGTWVFGFAFGSYSYGAFFGW
jgi:hypothetical protein